MIINIWKRLFLGARNLFKSRKKTAVLLLAILAIGILYTKTIGKSQPTTQYQTTVAEKGSLITTVTASGDVSIGGAVSITTNISGIANTVYVKNGDLVTTGQKIADITLDQASLQKQTSAWSSYLSAKNQVDSANNQINALQAAAFKANQTFMLDAVARDLATNDPVYIQEYALWLQAENNYKNQSNSIAQARANLSSSWYNYQQTSSTITAPTNGTISNLIIAQGLPIVSQTSSGSNTSTLQTLGNVVPVDGKVQAVVSLSEMDVVKVKTGQKATLTVDAFPDKTFTGSVLIVNTNGSVSSGVTNYPTTIVFDTAVDNIYPNMGVNATIITDIKNDVFLVPSSSIQTTNGITTVRLLANGKITSVPVTVGGSNNTQTEIVSGVKEGDTIVTSITTTTSNTRPTTPGTSGSIFGGGIGGNRATFGGGR